MRITLTRRGGFAGIRLPPISVDTAKLLPAVAAKLEALIADTDFSAAQAAPANPGGVAQPDRFSYTLTVDEKTYTFGEATAGKAVLKVVEAVQRAVAK